jgi:hypothetical protein
VRRGTVAGQRYRWQGMVGGRSAVEIETLWTVGPDYPEAWPHPKDGWTVTIEGDPSFKVHFMPAATFDRSRRATIEEHVHSADIGDRDAGGERESPPSPTRLRAIRTFPRPPARSAEPTRFAPAEERR